MPKCKEKRQISSKCESCWMMCHRYGHKVRIVADKAKSENYCDNPDCPFSRVPMLFAIR